MTNQQVGRRCEHCDKAITEESRPNAGLSSPARTRAGRPPRYCSTLCRSRASVARRKQLAEGLTHKVCAACKTDKPIDAFTEAWRSYCAECTRAQAKDRYRNSGGIERVYAANLATNYNMTPEQYAAKMESQEGRCAICGDKPTRRLHVDHDHKTGALRDLLCSHCNHAIGHAKEDPARLRAMIEYLERHRSVSSQEGESV